LQGRKGNSRRRTEEEGREKLTKKVLGQEIRERERERESVFVNGKGLLC